MQINSENPRQWSLRFQYALFDLYVETLQQYNQLALGNITKFMARYV